MHRWSMWMLKSRGCPSDKQVEKVISETSYALSVLRRLAGELGRKEMRTIADGLVNSKLRYCLPVYASESLRIVEADAQSTLMSRLQRTQNDMLRIVCGKRRRDHVRIVDMLSELGFLSVNQSAAYGLLIESWKARNFHVPILKDLLENKRNESMVLRSNSAGMLSTQGRDKITLNLERLWNMSSARFRSSNLLKVAKIEAKILVKSLPV